jgi:copper(I)-binding protein
MNPRNAAIRLAVASALALGATAAAAQVAVSDAWVRGTVAGQQATGAFMQLKSATDVALIAAASPVAGVVEVHEMKMVGGVMKMSAIKSLAVPAGKTTELKPGGYHVMLMDLKQPLKDGEIVSVTLTFEDRAGKRQTVEAKASVRPLTAPAANEGAHKH